MIKVTQEIPNSRFCANLSRFNNNRAEEKCIFLDRDFRKSISRDMEGFTCRRHREVILGMELSQETDKVVKCYACQMETCGGDESAEIGTAE